LTASYRLSDGGFRPRLYTSRQLVPNHREPPSLKPSKHFPAPTGPYRGPVFFDFFHIVVLTSFRKLMKKLVIVESPAKAKTIEKYLGKDFKVLSSIGHIRQIPPKGNDAIDIKNGFKAKYEIDPEKKRVVSDLQKAAKGAEVWLATDPDREGEAIAWHLAEVLDLPKNTKRIVYHEITKGAVEEAVANPRTIDMDLVEAQQARQKLDRIVGYELSPVVWRKVPGGKSAGRVQSPALRLIVEREREIENFESEELFKVEGIFNSCHPGLVPGSNGKGVAESDEKTDWTPEQVRGDEQLEAKLNTDFPDEKAARDFLEGLFDAKYIISDINTSPGMRNPGPPFTTSMLQQEANSKFGWSARTTMNAAQKLYQSGKITYMRTDSTAISNQALGSIGKFIESEYGKKYLRIRQFKTKSAGAQEAHEAIRPTNISIESVGGEYEQKLYDLIRRRTLASQMAAAEIEKTTVAIAICRPEAKAEGPRRSFANAQDDKTASAEPYFEAKGEVVTFDGFLKVYGNNKELVLPKLVVGDELLAESITARQTPSKPPARYTEGSLIKKLESLGIGRPSTYATILDNIQSRGYVEKGTSDGREVELVELVLTPRHPGPAPESNKKSVAESDEKSDWIPEQATAPDPTDLVLDAVRNDNRGARDDEITRNIVIEKTGADKGKLVPTAQGEVLSDFLVKYFDKVVDYDFTAEVENELDEIAKGKLDQVKMLTSFYEPFHKLIAGSDKIDRSAVIKSRELGKDPKTGKTISARVGRFGPMLQLGDSQSDDKPQFAPLPAGVNLKEVTLEQALPMFDLPRVVGKTDDGQEIIANIGRFGPYIKVGQLFVSIKPLEPQKITLDKAKKLYADKLAAEAAKNIADYGKIKVLNGHYGPYVTDGKKNAKIPKDIDPKKLTEEEAIKILESTPVRKARYHKARKKL